MIHNDRYLFVYAAIAQLVMWSYCSFKAMFFSIWSNRHDAREHDGIIPKRYILWLEPDFNTVLDSGFLESHAHNHVAPSVSTDLNKQPSPDPLSLSNWIWCFIAMETYLGIDLWFLTEVSCHILSSLLQGNSSLVDTWERCYAKLRRKKNKHSIVCWAKVAGWRVGNSGFFRSSCDTSFLLKAKTWTI